MSFTMSESDNMSSPEKDEMEIVSENGDNKVAGQKESGAESPAKTKVESPTKTKMESPTKTKMESPTKTKVESPAKKEKPKKQEEEEPPLGLLERPVILTSGKREKKKVERLSMTITLPNSEKKKVDIPEGKGTKLGDCPRVEFKLVQTKAADLKTLHRILFNRVGGNTEVKKNIRQFSGFTFAKGDKEFDKRMTALNKMTLPGLKLICEVLDVERKGTKHDIVERIMDFLLKPSSSGLTVQQKKKRRSKGDGEKGTLKRKRASKKKEKKKSPANKDTVSDISDSDDDDDNKEEEEEGEDKKEEKKPAAVSDSEEEEDEEEEEEEEAPPKKKAKVEKKTPAKKAPAKKQNGKQVKAAKTEKKESKKKSSVSDSEDSDSEDEPLVPKKEDPPSNSVLKDLIKKILEGANLEEVTMKTVVKQVYEKYPSFDLTDRKDFIKTTVREIIS